MNTHWQMLFAAGAGLILNSGELAAATFIKMDNTNSLNLGSSWDQGTVPTANDVIRVDGSLLTSRTSGVGDNIEVFGIEQAADVSRQWQISPSPDKVLTIGAGGIRVESAVSGARLILATAVALSADQTWTLANTHTGAHFQLNGPLQTNGHQLTIEGTTPQASLDLRGSNVFPPNVTIQANVIVNLLGSVVAFEGTNTFDTLHIANGTVYAASIGDYGVPSNLGDGGTNGLITLGSSAANAFLNYTGPSTSSNRNFVRDRRSPGSSIIVTDAATTLTLGGTLRLTTGGTAIGPTDWVFGGAGNLTLNGVIADSTATPIDVTGLVKTGTGILTLGADNTFTGPLQINGGGLVVNGSTSPSSSVTLADGLLLGGSGSIPGSIALGSQAQLEPGAGVGMLATGPLTAGSNLHYHWEISDASAAAGNGHDVVTLADGAALALGGPWTLHLHSVTNAGTPGPAANFNPAASYQWLVFASSQAVTGFDPATASVELAGFANSYSGTFALGLSADGTDVLLTYTGNGEPPPVSIFGTATDTVRGSDAWVWNPNLGWIFDGYFPWILPLDYGQWLYVQSADNTTEPGGFFIFDHGRDRYLYTTSGWYPFAVIASGVEGGRVVDLSVPAAQ
jgi:autotransporter-associated beta strand protein